MSEEDVKPSDVVPKPEETTPAPEHTPPAVPEPEAPKDDTRQVVNELTAKVDALAETVKTLVESGVEQQHDTSPVKKPWTHRPFFGR